MGAKRCSAWVSPLDGIADAIPSLPLPHPVRVAIDGRTASGKTTFADGLATVIEGSGRQVIRASIDGFHRPRAARHRQGRLSSDGYYEDARDLPAMSNLLLHPLGPGGGRSYATAAFDLEGDKPLKPVFRIATEDAVLIVDGTFLQRPELRPAWDFVVFLNVSEEEARRRGIGRDAPALGGRDATAELYYRRYGPAFARYEAECRPMEKADVVIDQAGGV